MEYAFREHPVLPRSLRLVLAYARGRRKEWAFRVHSFLPRSLHSVLMAYAREWRMGRAFRVHPFLPHSLPRYPLSRLRHPHRCTDRVRPRHSRRNRIHPRRILHLLPAKMNKRKTQRRGEREKKCTESIM